MRKYKVNKFSERRLRIMGMRLPSAIIVCLSILLSVFNLIAHFTFLQFLGSLTFTISVFLVCHFLIEKEGLDKLFDDKMPKEIHNDHPE